MDKNRGAVLTIISLIVILILLDLALLFPHNSSNSYSNSDSGLTGNVISSTNSQASVQSSSPSFAKLIYNTIANIFTKYKEKEPGIELGENPGEVPGYGESEEFEGDQTLFPNGIAAARTEWFIDQRKGRNDKELPQGYLLHAKKQIDDAKAKRNADKKNNGNSGSKTGGNSITGNSVSDITGYATADNILSWTNIGPAPFGIASGRIVTSVPHPTDPNTIYIASADGGVWKTINNGASWIPLTDSLPSLTSGSLAMDPTNPSILYYGTGEPYGSDSYGGVGMFKSIDNGTTWNPAGLQNEKRISKIIVSSSNPQIVIANTWGGIYTSTDGATTWTKTLSFTSNAINDLAFNPKNNNIVYATSGGGLYKSIDAGNIWNNITSYPYDRNVLKLIGVSYASPDIVYILTANYNLYKSIDQGNTWSSIAVPSGFCGTQCGYDLAIAVDPTNSSHVMIGGVSTYYSNNSGANWSFVTTGLHSDAHSIVFGPGHVYVTHDGGVSESSNSKNMSSFVYMNGNLAISQFNSVGLDNLNPKNVWGGAQETGTGKTDGSSLQWVQTIGGDGTIVVVDPTNSNIVYAELPFGAHYRSINGGINFDKTQNGIVGTGVFITPVAMDPTNSNILYTSGGNGVIYKTGNKGDLWTPTATTYPWGYQRNEVLSISPQENNIIYVGNAADEYRSNDNGTTWTNIGGALPFAMPTSIVPDPKINGTVYVTFSGTFYKHIFKSTNYGATWINIDGDYPSSLPANSFVVDKYDNYYVGSDLGVFVSIDNGQSWVHDDALPNSAVMMLGISSDNYLYAATHGRSMWKALLPSPTSSTGSVPVLTYYNLSVSTTGSGVVVSSDGVISCPGVCSGFYQNGTSIVLTANPGAGYQFSSWTGCSSTSLNTCIVSVMSDKSVTASFSLIPVVIPSVVNYSVFVSVVGSGSVAGYGISCPGTCMNTFVNGTLVNLTATASSGYDFSGWFGCDSTSTNICIMNMNNNKSITANFTLTPVVMMNYSLAVTKSGTGSGVVSSSPLGINCGSLCSANYNSGVSVALTATPNSGSVFSGWSGGGCTGTGLCNVVMNSAQSVVATFTLIPVVSNYSLTTSIIGSGSVSVNGVSCAGTCSSSFAQGTSVTLIATPSSGYTFSGWSGSCTGTGSCTVVMNSAQSVSATFVQNFVYSINSIGNQFVVQGSSVNIPVSTNLVSGVAQPVSYSVSGVPSGVTASFNPVSCTPSCSSTLALSSGPVASTGAFVITVYATSGSVVKNTSFTLTVNSAVYTLSVSKSGSGLGTVTSSDTNINCGSLCSANYNSGVSVALTATPNSGSVFSGWSGGGCTGTGLCNVVMNSAQSVSAIFGSAPVADTVPPVVIISSPKSNATVSGTVTISVSASDNVAVSKIQVYVDNILYKTCSAVTSCPYNWNTKKTSSGLHVIKSIATDSSGNTASVSVLVKK